VSRRTRRALAGVALLVVAGLVGAVLVARAADDDDGANAPRRSPSTATVHPVPAPSTATTTTTTPRPWRTGFNNGEMPMSLGDVELARDLDGIAATGARWLRIDFYWAIVQAGGPDSWDWSGTDRVVEAVHRRGMEVLALAAYTPEWARPPGTSDHHPPLDPETFGRFMREAVARYAPSGVDTWEIWNEPNVDVFWSPAPDPGAYARLLRVAYDAVKSVDPDATVVSGGLAAQPDAADGSSYSAGTFLTGVYDGGGGGAFDAVGLHPQSFPALPLEPFVWNSFYGAPLVYQVMVRHGDGHKRIWATEFATPTGGFTTAVTPERQADIVSEGYRAWVAWPFTGPLIVYAYRDRGDDAQDFEAHFGLVYHDRTPKPALHAFERAVRDLERLDRRGRRTSAR
jgi:hypothetical protein